MTYPHPETLNEAIAMNEATELRHPSPSAAPVAVQGLKHLHAEQVKTNQLLAEILAALKHQSRPAPAQQNLPGMAPKTAQTPQTDKPKQVVSGNLGRDAKTTQSGKMVMFSLENLDGLPLRFIKVKATKQLKECGELREGDLVEVTYSEVKEEPNYKDQTKMDKFIWLESLTVKAKAPPPPPSEYDASPVAQDPMGFPVDDSLPF